MHTSSQSVLTCPLTRQPFKDPRILLEDGFSYEKSAIETWLRDRPNESPMIGDIPSATVLPNGALFRDPVCPITKESFKEPYYCKEDCQTYEKDAIIKWFETRLIQNIEARNYARFDVKSPMNGIELESLTLYPNKLLFPNGNFPNLQEPLRFEVSNFLPAPAPAKITYIFDTEIRELICNYFIQGSDFDEGLKDKINARRTALGLQIKESFSEALDLSHLDLSNLTLEKMEQKRSFFKDTNFSGSTLIDCGFGRCRFVDCNLQRTTLINCEFPGEEVSFYNSDMKDAVIEMKKGYIEKGTTWERITQPNEFRAELKARGALNTDSITFR